MSFFSFLKRKPSPPQEPRKARACLPTHVSGQRLILSKAATSLRDSYEFRLIQQFAIAKGLRLVLALRPSAQLEPSLAAFLKKHGVEITEAQVDDYSVYFGHAKRGGEDGDGWVLGNSVALNSLKQATRSLWLRDRLRIGAAFDGDTLLELEKTLQKENTRVLNVDGENVRDAVLELIATAKREGGVVYIQ